MRRILICAAAACALLLIWFLWSATRPAGNTRQETFSVSQTLGGAAAPGYLRADKPRRFSFPADHGPHPGFRNEWWYFTGNLHAADGRRFGYQLTFFKTALTPVAVTRASAWGTNEVYMAHFAVTDVAGRKYRFAERFSRAALGLAGAGGDPLAVRLEDWSALQTSPRPWGVRLTAAEPDFAVDFDLVSVKPEVLNGAGGLSRKGATPGNASYYYSIPRLATSGTLRLGTERFAVSGLSWLDREWSTSALEPDQVGWDWFALHLDDGRDLMFYQLRRRDGSSDPFSGGTLVAADGSSRNLSRDEVQLEVVSWWQSPASGVRYPSVWRLRIPTQGLALEVVPWLAEQELLTAFRYWEGAVAVRGLDGSPGGSGYLEMTGYKGAAAENKEPLR
ncbi:carotenoid 1,2-hydratase [Geomonas paludis]|uniref:Carotenoid 1,2-hydratase n=1 Tax=Geomonas paludis TaxID=2740185 RepID=A0A6V8MT38_9BACT|nr:lipocalin-like domain-containing protein [Geomonas paludis]UPU38144.1 carotenoid 1,2-hydratase [Geomonas paludis]GFO63326.1 carotenoid 1,2-hydratase [Geomonas paludis]